MITTGTIQAGVDFSRVGYKTDIVLSDGTENGWVGGESVYRDTIFFPRWTGFVLSSTWKYSIPYGDSASVSSMILAVVDNPASVPGDGSRSGPGKVSSPVSAVVLIAFAAQRADRASIDWRHQDDVDDMSAWVSPASNRTY